MVILDISNGEGRAALIEDGNLIDLIIEPPLVMNDQPEDRRGYPDIPPPGAIYRGKVTSQSNAMGIFVDIGNGQTALLRSRRKYRSGDMIVLQVTGYSEPGKACPADDRVLHKGQLSILTPGSPGVNVSRSIKDPEERERLQLLVRKTIADLKAAPARIGETEDLGVIVRTAAQGCEDDWLINDVGTHLQVLHDREEASAKQELPGLIFGGAPTIVMPLTEWMPPKPDMIVFWGNSDNIFDIQALLSNHTWHDRIDTSIVDPFDHFGVWDEIERLKSPRVELPSGGWMAVEATRAMVTVDVNTGDQFGGGAAMTANIETARELPRQLRLRGLGGQIVIDFAPLKKAHRKKIEETLKAAFRHDTVATTLAGWTPLGNFELQRKRERRPLSEVLSSL